MHDKNKNNSYLKIYKYFHDMIIEEESIQLYFTAVSGKVHRSLQLNMQIIVSNGTCIVIIERSIERIV